MKSVVKLPIGIENFEKMRTEGFYYVDKTGLITELLNNWGKVNLFTRPRRFGKSLNMNMLKYFFSYGCDPELFRGLAVSEEKELCEKYMGKFPVIFITLKSVEALNYDDAETDSVRSSAMKRCAFSFCWKVNGSLIKKKNNTPSSSEWMPAVNRCSSCQKTY